jgi:hypothetical protein
VKILLKMNNYFKYWDLAVHQIFISFFFSNSDQHSCLYRKIIITWYFWQIWKIRLLYLTYLPPKETECIILEPDPRLLDFIHYLIERLWRLRRLQGRLYLLILGKKIYIYIAANVRPASSNGPPRLSYWSDNRPHLKKILPVLYHTTGYFIIGCKYLVQTIQIQI